MVKRIIYLCFTLLVLAGCSYSVYSNAYPHLKKIRVMAFENKTSEFDLADKALEILSAQFNSDGRLKLVTQQPDCQLDGSITDYKESVYSYDAANNVQDYQIRITFSVALVDLVNNQTIYENNNLVITEQYAVSALSSSQFKSKEEALNEIIRNLFKAIVQNSLENW